MWKIARVLQGGGVSVHQCICKPKGPTVATNRLQRKKQANLRLRGMNASRQRTVHRLKKNITQTKMQRLDKQKSAHKTEYISCVTQEDGTRKTSVQLDRPCLRVGERYSPPLMCMCISDVLRHLTPSFTQKTKTSIYR